MPLQVMCLTDCGRLHDIHPAIVGVHRATPARTFHQCFSVTQSCCLTGQTWAQRPIIQNMQTVAHSSIAASSVAAAAAHSAPAAPAPAAPLFLAPSPPAAGAEELPVPSTMREGLHCWGIVELTPITLALGMGLSPPTTTGASLRGTEPHAT